MKRFLLCCVLLGAFFQCCPSNVGQKVGVKEPEEAATPTIYKVGDVVQVKDHTITLNSADASGGVLTANFTVENVGNKEIIMSSLMDFSARGPDGSKLGIAICDGPQLDGKVLPGDKLRADLCWKAQAQMGVKIYYEPSLFGRGAIVWELE